MGIFQQLILDGRGKTAPHPMKGNYIDDTGLFFAVSDLLSLTVFMYNPMRGYTAYFAQFSGAVIQISAEEFRHALYASRLPLLVDLRESDTGYGVEWMNGDSVSMYIMDEEKRKQYQYPNKVKRGTPVQQIWRELEK